MGIVTRENIGLLNDKIIVRVAQQDYLPSFEKALKEYGKKANLPGFRKGMVPPGLIKKMYGSSVFADEVLRSVEKELSSYMEHEKLEIFAQPLPMPENDAHQINMSHPDEYSFAFEVGLKPEFQLSDLATYNPVRYKIEVTDQMIDEELDRLRVRNGKMTEPDKISQEDDVLNVTFVESDGEGVPIDGGVRKDNSLLVKYFTESFRADLMGKSKGDWFICQLSKAFEDKERAWILHDLGLPEQDASAADKYFRVEITKIGLVEKAPLDESFYKIVIPQKEITSLEEFRADLKDEIQKYWDNQSRNHLQHALYHRLLEDTKIEFPETFLKRWLLKGGEKPKTAQQVEEEFPAFSDQLKWTLIMDKIARVHQITVESDDLREFARHQLLGYMGPEAASAQDQPWISDYIARMMQDKRFVEDAVQRIRTDKVLAWAEKQVTANETPIGREEFLHLQEAHTHHH